LLSNLKNKKQVEGYESIYIINGFDAPPARAGPTYKNLMTVVD
jgi:hypothetical protein